MFMFVAFYFEILLKVEDVEDPATVKMDVARKCGRGSNRKKGQQTP